MTDARIAFFGTSEFSVYALETLAARNILPSLVVTTPDSPQGRKLVVTPCPAKVWAQSRGIPVISPATLRGEEALQALAAAGPFDLFIVASYGKIIPQSVLDLPRTKPLNIHPSLLPAFRGPSPIESAILGDKGETGAADSPRMTGVTIMEVDAEMDHGPIAAVAQWRGAEWPAREALEKELAVLGANALANIIPGWLSGEAKPVPQDYSLVTLTRKFEKADGLIHLSAAGAFEGALGRKNFLTIRAMSGRPGAYSFFDTKKGKMRVVLKDAEWKNDALAVTRVIPEGKKEMSFEEFRRNFI